MLVNEIMTRDVVTIEMDDSLAQAREIFNNVKFHHLLVMERKKLVGVLSDRDLLEALSPLIGTPSERSTDLATLKKRVHQVMARKLVTISADATVVTAATRMLEEGISCLPVVGQGGAVEGIVTLRDLAKVCARRFD